MNVLPKQYVEARLSGERVTRAQLVEVVGPPPVPGHMPKHIAELLPGVRPLLGSAASRRLAREQAEQENKEAEDG